MKKILNFIVKVFGIIAIILIGYLAIRYLYPYLLENGLNKVIENLTK